MDMFCFQCQEANKNYACTSLGICGKTSELAVLQDILVYLTKEISSLIYNNKISSKDLGETNPKILTSLFMTITNANFDEQNIKNQIFQLISIKNELLKQNKNNVKVKNIRKDNYIEAGKKLGVLASKNQDIRSLRELISYGLKGMAAYMEHAYNLGYEDMDLYDFMYKALAKTIDDSLSLEDLLGLSLETGQYGVKAMELLDKANTGTYGHPEISQVNIGVNTNPSILVSGHDLKDLKELLDQTKDSGVDVYTHCEMLPAHYYPDFKKYKHFVGNYGNAWWKQEDEFQAFKGPILFTTNCIVPPKNKEVQARIFTTGASAFPGCKHITKEKLGKKDFSPIIEMAKTLASPEEIEKGYITGGFAHNQVFQLVDKIVEEVEKGNIKKFFVMAGCDGRMNSRTYYTDFAKNLPKDTVILTAGCAKYRYNKLNLGDINGIPRVLDAGQCNDSYSLVLIALKLQEIFKFKDINELPIVYNISWYEQKAVIVLLALLALGIKNIHLGPSLPAFLSENVINILVENFGICGISNVEEDLNLFLK